MPFIYVVYAGAASEVSGGEQTAWQSLLSAEGLSDAPQNVAKIFIQLKGKRRIVKLSDNLQKLAVYR